MSDKIQIPVHFQVQVEERLSQPADKQWHAQFSCYPLGFFRGSGHSPAAALAVAWKKFRRAVHPGKRWWLVAFRTPPYREDREETGQGRQKWQFARLDPKPTLQDAL